MGPGGVMNNKVKPNIKKYIESSVDDNYFENLWKSRNKNSNYVAVDEDGKVVGFVIMSRKNPYFHKIELIGAKQGARVGSSLVSQIIDNSRNSGALALELNAIPSAKGFYEKLGFKTFGTKLANGNINTHTMILNLQGSFTLGKKPTPVPVLQKPRTRRTTQRRVGRKK